MRGPLEVGGPFWQKIESLLPNHHARRTHAHTPTHTPTHAHTRPHAHTPTHAARMATSAPATLHDLLARTDCFTREELLRANFESTGADKVPCVADLGLDSPIKYVLGHLLLKALGAEKLDVDKLRALKSAGCAAIELPQKTEEDIFATLVGGNPADLKAFATEFRPLNLISDEGCGHFMRIIALRECALELAEILLNAHELCERHAGRIPAGFILSAVDLFGNDGKRAPAAVKKFAEMLLPLCAPATPAELIEKSGFVEDALVTLLWDKETHGVVDIFMEAGVVGFTDPKFVAQFLRMIFLGIDEAGAQVAMLEYLTSPRPFPDAQGTPLVPLNRGVVLKGISIRQMVCDLFMSSPHLVQPIVSAFDLQAADFRDCTVEMACVLDVLPVGEAERQALVARLGLGAMADIVARVRKFTGRGE